MEYPYDNPACQLLHRTEPMGCVYLNNMKHLCRREYDFTNVKLPLGQSLFISKTQGVHPVIQSEIKHGQTH